MLDAALPVLEYVSTLVIDQTFDDKLIVLQLYRW